MLQRVAGVAKPEGVGTCLGTYMEVGNRIMHAVRNKASEKKKKERKK